MRGEKCWALKSVVLILLVYLGSSLLFEILAGDIIGSEPSLSSILIGEMVDGIIILLLLRAASQSYSINLSDIGITYQLPWKDLFLGLLLGGALWLGAGIISDALRPLIPSWTMVPEEYDFVTLYANSQGMERAFLFLAMAFTTPVIEELLFRGLIYSILKRGFSVHASVILSSSLFGLWHAYLELIVISFLIGYGLAWLREKGKSLVGPIMAHTTINSMSIVFS